MIRSSTEAFITSSLLCFRNGLPEWLFGKFSLLLFDQSLDQLPALGADVVSFPLGIDNNEQNETIVFKVDIADPQGAALATSPTSRRESDLPQTACSRHDGRAFGRSHDCQFQQPQVVVRQSEPLPV